MDTIHKDIIRKQINDWTEKYRELKDCLAEFRDLDSKGALIEYNIICVQAMTLHEGIGALMLMLDK